ncbi:hypothetical protein MBGDN05_00355, partial [Thermoplasmatales archaeon SCGC AB-539-N05]
MKIKKSILMLVIAVTIALLLFGLATLPSVTATDTITSVDISGSYYKASSGLKGVIKLTITGDASDDYFEGAHFTFAGGGWDANDIVDLSSTPANSGVAVYIDSNDDGSFSIGADSGLTPGSTYNGDWSNGGVASLTAFSNNTDTYMGTNSKVFFIVIQTDSTLDDTDAITFTLDNVTINGVVGAVGTTISFTGDTTAPTLSTLTTGDDNSDGTVDRIVAVFTENIYESVGEDNINEATGFSASGGGTPSISSVSETPDGTLTFAITGCTADDTSVTPNLIYAKATGSIVDRAENELDDFNTASTDGAAPVINSISGSDSDNDGKINSVAITFSETIPTVGSHSGIEFYVDNDFDGNIDGDDSALVVSGRTGDDGGDAVIQYDFNDNVLGTGQIYYDYYTVTGGIDDSASNELDAVGTDSTPSPTDSTALGADDVIRSRINTREKITS